MTDAIDPLPTPPNRGMQDREEFVVVTDAFLAALPNFVTQVNAFAADENDRIGQAFTGTFSAALAITTGVKSFTGPPNMALSPGQVVTIAVTASPGNSMTGYVVSYDAVTGASAVNVTAVAGSGSFSDWSIGFAAVADLSGYVTLTGVQTVTNKTFTSPTVNTPTITNPTVSTGTFTTPTLAATVSGTAAGRLGYSGGAVSFGDGSVQRIVATLDGVQAFTNKDVIARVSTNTSITSPWAWNSDSYDCLEITAQAGALTISADAGTPVNFRKRILRIAASGADRVITFTGGSSKAFINAVGSLLTVSGANWTYTVLSGKTAEFGCIYNTNTSRWRIVGIAIDG